MKLIQFIFLVLFAFITYHHILYDLLYEYKQISYKNHWKTIYKGNKGYLNLFVLILIIHLMYIFIYKY